MRFSLSWPFEIVRQTFGSRGRARGWIRTEKLPLSVEIAQMIQARLSVALSQMNRWISEKLVEQIAFSFRSDRFSLESSGKMSLEFPAEVR